MGQKVCPIGFRLGITQGWKSIWYADKKNFGSLLVEDQKIRKIIKINYGFAGISVIEIGRNSQVKKIKEITKPELHAQLGVALYRTASGMLRSRVNKAKCEERRRDDAGAKGV